MKGFTHTLEAIIGSLMLLSIGLVLVPQMEQADGSAPALVEIEESDIAGRMDNMTPLAAEAEAREILSRGYSTNSFVRKTSTFSYRADSDPERFINRTGGSLVLHVFVEEGSFSASYRGTRFADSAGPGYYQEKTSATSGYLNFSGSFQATVEVVNQSIEGEANQGPRRSFYSFITYNGSPTEVRLAAWN